MSGAGAVIAHQGGWDEMLFVAVPIALFALLLALANKRAAREQAAPDGAGVAGDEPPSATGSDDSDGAADRDSTDSPPGAERAVEREHAPDRSPD